MRGGGLFVAAAVAISGCVAVASHDAAAYPTTDTFELQVHGVAGIPGDTQIAGQVLFGAEAVVLNLTATNTEGFGFITAWPCGELMPMTANLNFAPGRDIANLVIARVGAGGKVCIKSSANTNVIADAAGYFPAGSWYTPTANPVRILDTRAGVGAPAGYVTAGGTVTLQVTGGVSGVPNNAEAVVMNVTAAGTKEYGYVTAYPCDQQRPVASNLNFVAEQDNAGLVIARLSAAGTVCLFTYGSTHLLADVAGYFPAGSDYKSIANPERILDTRNGTGAPQGKVAAQGTVALQVGGVAGVPTNAAAVVINATVAESAAAGFATIYPCDQLIPNASNINYVAAQERPNLVIARLDPAGKVCLFTDKAAHLIGDLAGYFPAGSDSGYVALNNPTRLLDSRTIPAPATTTTAPATTTATTGPTTTAGSGGVPPLYATNADEAIAPFEPTDAGTLGVHAYAWIAHAIAY